MIAIVIPYYKKKYFTETLDSLAVQTNKNFHVYIGNDNSPEDPKDILGYFQNKFRYTYKLFENNLGQISLTQQWDRCLELIRDEKWVMILGDDDYISSNYIEKFYENIKEIEALNIQVVRFSTIVVNELTGENSKLYTHPKIEKSTDFFYNKFFKSSRGSLSENIFTKESYKKHGFRNFPLAWGADTFAWLDFTEFGDIYTINNANAYFRVSPYNISRGGYKEDIKNKASFIYFNLIVDQYLYKFSGNQRLRILIHYEHLARISANLTLLFFAKMIKNLFLEKDYLEIIKFSRRMLYYKTKI